MAVNAVIMKIVFYLCLCHLLMWCSGLDYLYMYLFLIFAFLSPFGMSKQSTGRIIFLCALALLCVVFSCVFVTVPYGVPGKVWYLIVSVQLSNITFVLILYFVFTDGL